MNLNAWNVPIQRDQFRVSKASGGGSDKHDFFFKKGRGNTPPSNIVKGKLADS